MQILQPQRRVDMLRDIMDAQRHQRPYVVTFCGVNGVGKSTNLAKVSLLSAHVPASLAPLGLWQLRLQGALCSRRSPSGCLRTASVSSSRPATPSVPGLWSSCALTPGV